MSWFSIIIIWAILGFICLCGAVEELEKLDPSKKQWAFLFCLLGPICWCFGILLVLGWALSKIWEKLK